MKIYLDDIRDAPKGWTRAYTVEETINYLRQGHVEELSLDHDLGFTDPKHSGYDVLVWLEKQLHLSEVGKSFVPKVIFIHTQNPVGRKRMEQALTSIYSEKESLLNRT